MVVKVKKDALVSLTTDALKYRALERGEVDNWTFYSDALSDFLGDIPEDKEDYEDWELWEEVVEKYVEELVEDGCKELSE